MTLPPDTVESTTTWGQKQDRTSRRRYSPREEEVAAHAARAWSSERTALPGVLEDADDDELGVLEVGELDVAGGEVDPHAARTTAEMAKINDRLEIARGRADVRTMVPPGLHCRTLDGCQYAPVDARCAAVGITCFHRSITLLMIKAKPSLPAKEMPPWSMCASPLSTSAKVS